MKHLRDIIGYLLGLVLFVGLMPTLMWLASGRPAFWLEVAPRTQHLDYRLYEAAW